MVPIFIGDEVSAAGFRLAGLLARTPPPGEEAPLFESALGETSLVLVTAEVAARIPTPLLSRALAGPLPLVLVIPDVRGRRAPLDLGRAMRLQLGMEP
ncbi:V-type ATP synthase subunit F [Pelomicrobium sp. G1]|uniref:V-type ATP synthase subunit F n=1 Tax=Pelomicrobium sp. G1 TaxID=3452920 RepID=UPI0034964D95